MSKRIVAFAVLIFLALLPLCVEGQSTLPREGKGKKVNVPFDHVKGGILWQPSEKKWFKCEVLDWNLVGKPYPQLTISIPPRAIFTPIRLYLLLTWKEETGPPPWYMGIDGHPRRPCKFKVEDDRVLVEMTVYGKTK